MSHTSGLPRTPPNLDSRDPDNPYAGYDVEHMYEFLTSYQLLHDIGSRFEYSNLGYGLLGHVLERCTGADYESLVRAVVLEPLGMTSTLVQVRPEMMAQGYDDSDRPTKSWDLGVLVGAGGLKSSANDMMTFLAANLGYLESPLRAAMLRMRHVRGMRETEDSMGWRILSLEACFSSEDPHVVIANGGTGGYTTFVGFNPNAGAGIVVMANASPAVALDAVESAGLHILDDSFPL